MSKTRNETEMERLDRKWNDLLQELRVMQTGAQLIAGFLLTLPFTDRFADLDAFQVRLYLTLVLLAVVTTALIIAAVAVHRRLSGSHIKERVVVAGHRLTMGVLTTLSLLITGMVLLIFDVVVGRTSALLWASGMALFTATVVGVLPFLLGRDRD